MIILPAPHHGRAVAEETRWRTTLQPYIIYFKYKNPNDKAPGPVRQYRVYATSLEEARRLATQYANYPNVEVLNVRPA